MDANLLLDMDENTTSEDSRPTKRQRLDAATDTSGSYPPGTIVSEFVDKERNCGILAFVRPNTSRFSGVLKQRYTDFLVNEILQDGTVLHLVDVGPPHKAKDSAAEDSQAPRAASSVVTTTEEIDQVNQQRDAVQDEHATAQPVANDVSERDLPWESAEDTAELIDVFGEGTVQGIRNLWEQLQDAPDRKPATFGTIISPEVADRAKRTTIHQLVRKMFSSRLDTVTGDNGTISISVAKKRPSYQVADHGRAQNIQYAGTRGQNKLSWQEQGGEHLHFTLHKENRDSMEVLSFLGTQMKLKSKRFAMAGTKDRRAVTVQRCSIYRMNAKQLHAVGKRLKGSVLGDFEYRPNGLQLGDSCGNQFVITLRDVHTPNDENVDLKTRLQRVIDASKDAVRGFRDQGFLNYYGLQRFGSYAVSTSQIGRKILQDDLNGAVDDILHFSESAARSEPDTQSDVIVTRYDKIATEDRQRATAIKTWREGRDGKQASSQMPRKFHAEAQLMQHLSRRDRANDFQGALMTLPRNLRLMYVHAYQSLVWNRMVTRRWELYGERVVEGDLVIINERDERMDLDKNQGAEDANGELVVNPAAEDSAPMSSDYTRARPLTAAEADSGAHTIFDIVLPLPGYDVVYPAHEVGTAYEQFMGSEEGGRLDPHNMRRKWKDASLSGSYRKILAKPLSVDYHFTRIQHGEEDMVSTDLQRVRAQKPRPAGENLVIEADQDEEGYDEDAEWAEYEKILGLVDANDPPELVKDGVSVRLQSKHALKQGADKLAVTIKFSLGPSTYATMALRELMGAGACKEYKPEYGGRET